MNMRDFSKIAHHYEKTSKVQELASGDLFDLARIGPEDDVLDLGCGPGHLTKKIRGQTQGRIVGVDMSEGMIAKARETCGELNISFQVCQGEEIDFTGEFDIVFCNSTFHWFTSPEKVLENAHRALRKGGRIAVQAPARKVYSPTFVSAIETAALDPRTRDVFRHFRPPWFLLESPEEYSAFFERSGFRVSYSQIRKIVTEHSADEVFTIFDSAASAGYMNPRYYAIPFAPSYVDELKAVMRESFGRLADPNGMVELTFYRFYLLGQKAG
jgi:ubiquinone/menaquinone biosynthesis C-methylase UbiE